MIHHLNLLNCSSKLGATDSLLFKLEIIYIYIYTFIDIYKYKLQIDGRHY